MDANCCSFEDFRAFIYYQAIELPSLERVAADLKACMPICFVESHAVASFLRSACFLVLTSLPSSAPIHFYSNYRSLR